MTPRPGPRRRHPLAQVLARVLGGRARRPASTAPPTPGVERRHPLPPVERTARTGRGVQDEPGLTAPLTLERVEAMITGPMGYGVQRHETQGHGCLLGTWDSFPFVIEEPHDHEGWLLVAGEWEEPVGAGQREDLAASVNDWNRERFFPTVSVIDTGVGPLVRAVYLVDLSAGVTDSQLRLHLETGLSSCTQALAQVGPLLPEL